jgi:hypothetical protein
MFHHIGRCSLGTVHPRLTGQANADISNLFVTENNHDISLLYNLSSCSYYGFGTEYIWDPDPDPMGSAGPKSGEAKRRF